MQVFISSEDHVRHLSYFQYPTNFEFKNIMRCALKKIIKLINYNL